MSTLGSEDGREEDSAQVGPEVGGPPSSERMLTPMVFGILQHNASCGQEAVSQSTVSVIKNRSFRNVQVKTARRNFSRCTECDFLQDCISRYPRGCKEWATLVNDRTRHINYQNACL
jgi:lipopolysaccharide biosynthesis regulator YciM